MMPIIFIPVLLKVFVFATLFMLSEIGAQLAFECESLKPALNVELSCRNISSREPDAEGGKYLSTCMYKCKKYYIPTYDQSMLRHPQIDQQIKCSSRGNWNELEKFKRFSCKEDCGRRLYSPHAFIFNGNPTNSSTWPWHSTLFRKHEKTTTWHYICGGSLIRNSVILTAAHCVTLPSGRFIPPGQFRVILGGSSRNFTQSSKGQFVQIFEVEMIYISPSFDPRGCQGDIALIHLKGKDGVQFNEYIRPVCLSNEYALDLNALEPGRIGDVVGFGDNGDGLKHGLIRMASQQECSVRIGRPLTESQFCAGTPEDVGGGLANVCNGDSGGGYVFPSAIDQKYHIHGIVSTGSEPRGRKTICQSYAVFTRVFQFYYWIRDVLEQVHGDKIRELLPQANKYPYIQQGSDTMNRQFSPIPREWDNLITSIQLLHFNIGPQIFFKNLQNNRGIELLNLTGVKFTQSLNGHRIILPYLTGFVLDIPELDCQSKGKGGQTVENEACAERDPTKLSTSFIKSLIFFDKVDSPWDFDEISHLKTNIKLTIETSILVNINHQQHSIVLNLPDCSPIITNLVEGFFAQNVALSICELNIRQIIQSGHLKGVKSFTLQNVNYKNGTLSQLIPELKELEELYIGAIHRPWGVDDEHEEVSQDEPYAKTTTVYLDLIPSFQKIKVLAFRNVNVQLMFPAQIQTGVSKLVFQNLQTYFCSFCLMESEIIAQFENLFPNAKNIILGGIESFNVRKLVTKMRKLEEIIFTDVNGNEDEEEKKIQIRKLVGLNEFPTLEEQLDRTSLTEFKISRINGSWNKSFLNKSIGEFLSWEFNGLYKFWTSFEEWESGLRLSSFEKQAYSTGNYEFRGDGVETRVRSIPSAIAINLKSITIQDTEIIPSELIHSLNSAFSLQSLILRRVGLIGYFNKFTSLPNLKEYRLSIRSNPGFDFENFWEEHRVDSFIPFSQHSFQRFDYLPRRGESRKMEILEISWENCIFLYVDFKLKILRSVAKTNPSGFLEKLNSTDLKRISLRNTETEFFTLTLPADLEAINVFCISETISTFSTKVSQLLNSLNKLFELRLSLFHFYEIHNRLGTNTRTRINLFDLKKFENGFKVIALVETHIQYFPEVKFPVLQILFFEGCSYDEEVLSNFFNIFGNPRTIAIIALRSDVEYYGAESIAKRQKMNQRILLESLQNPKVQRVFGYLGNMEDMDEYKTEYTQDIFNILIQAGVPTNELHEFILERKNGTWQSVILTSPSVTREKIKTHKDLFQLKISRLRGDAIFGTTDCFNSPS